MKTIVRTSLTEQIYSTLKEEILSQKLPCGSKLNTRELQEKFQVSSTPIREALNRLVTDGLVKYETNVGCWIPAIRARDIREINDLVALFDCHAIELAIEHPKFDQLVSDLKETLDQQQRADADGDSLQYQQSTSRFHTIFYRYADNQRLNALVDAYNNQMRIFAEKYDSKESEKHHAISIREHTLIYYAVKDRDTESAKKYMREHIFETRDLLLAELEAGTLF